ncbi:MAG: hypothetical protein ACF8XB_05520 [Planctomycetota bacterium JB042]
MKKCCGCEASSSRPRSRRASGGESPIHRRMRNAEIGREVLPGSCFRRKQREGAAAAPHDFFNGLVTGRVGARLVRRSPAARLDGGSRGGVASGREDSRRASLRTKGEWDMRPNRLLTCIASLAMLTTVSEADTAVLVVLDVKTGSASADVSASAIAANGGKIQVLVKNSLGVAWNDLTVELIRKGSPTGGGGGGTPQDPGFGSADLTNGSHTGSIDHPDTSSAGGASAHFGPGVSPGDFGPAYTGGTSISCLLTGCDAGSYGMTQVVATPSATVASQESNLFGPFRMSTVADLLRLGNPATEHAQVVGRLVNVDDERALDSLGGVMTLPTGCGVAAVAIRENTPGTPLRTGAVVTVENGTTFSVSGLDLGPQEEVLVVVELSAAPSRELVAMELEASFADGT